MCDASAYCTVAGKSTLVIGDGFAACAASCVTVVCSVVMGVHAAAASSSEKHVADMTGEYASDDDAVHDDDGVACACASSGDNSCTELGLVNVD